MIAPSSSVSDRSPTGPSPDRRPVRVPQLLLSLLLVALCALLAVWWQARTTAREPALALARDVEAGVPLTSADLTEIYLSTDVGAATEDPEFRDLFVGVSPVADLSAGTIVTADMFRTVAALRPTEALVGLRVSADEAPASLARGDRVQVLVAGADGEPEILAPDALIESLGSGSDSGTVRVQLRMGVVQAQRVQIVADQVVLIEVAPSDVSSWDEPGEG
ncbi:MAG: hypothetical protein AAF567_13280 [Actinomycetota bacterium]